MKKQYSYYGIAVAILAIIATWAVPALDSNKWLVTGFISMTILFHLIALSDITKEPDLTPVECLKRQAKTVRDKLIVAIDSDNHLSELALRDELASLERQIEIISPLTAHTTYPKPTLTT